MAAKKMPPKMSDDELSKFGIKFAKALTKGQKNADALAADEAESDYEFGQQIKGKYFKGQKLVGTKADQKKDAPKKAAKESLSVMADDIRALLSEDD